MKKLVLFLLFVVPAYALTVPLNVSLNVSEGNASLWYPGGNLSLNLSGNFSAFYSLDVTVQGGKVSANLSGNASQTFAGCFENLNVSCAAASCVNQTVYVNATCQNTTTTVYLNQSGLCQRSASLYPGDHYVVNDSSCNINFTCQTAIDTCTNQTFNITRSVDVTRNGDLVTMSLGNYTSSFSMGVTNASFSVPMSFSCPLQALDVSDPQTMDVFGICSAYFPQVMGFFNLTLNKCFNNFDDYKAYVSAHEAVVQQANQELSDCRADNGLKQGKIDENANEIAGYRAQIAELQETNNTITIGCFVLAFLAIVEAIAIGFLWHYAERGE